MLDFYLINCSDPKPNNTKELEFVSSIDFETFENLKNKKIIESRFDYYSDFRLSNQLVLQMKINIQNLRILEKNVIQQSDTDKFLHILNKALENNCGLIAYCD